MNSASANGWPAPNPGECFNVTLNDTDSLLITAPAIESAPSPGSGPAIRSPDPIESASAWLHRLLKASHLNSCWSLADENGGTWLVEAAGATARVQYASVAGTGDMSQFRHDARNRLNAIGMNADLIVMQTSRSENTAATEAARRIQSGNTALRDLIDSLGTSNGSGHRSLAAVLMPALERLNIPASIEKNDGDDTAPAPLLGAATSLAMEWLLWCFARERKSNGAAGLGVPLVEISHRTLAIELQFKPAGDSVPGSFGVLTDSPLEQPLIAELDPRSRLQLMGAGFGAWQQRDRAGICIGLDGAA